jgi:hypothetical protein
MDVAWGTYSQAGLLRRRRRWGTSSRLVFAYFPGDSVAGKGGTFTRAGNASYWDISGIVQTATSGVIRDAHYLYGFRHTLIEPARTNSALWSADLTNAAWTKTNCAIGGSVTAPDATAAMTVLGEIGANGTFAASIQNAAAYAWTASTNQTFGIWAKPGNKSQMFISTTDKAGAVASSWVNATTGVRGTTAGTHAVKVWAFANGWFRVEMRLSTSGVGGGGQIITFGFADADNSLNLTGDAVTVNGYFWGAQHEQDQPWVSSYLPTTNAAVTRVADSLGWPHGSKPQPRTLYFDQTNIGAPSSQNGTMTVWRISNAGGNNNQHTSGGSGGNNQARLTNNGTVASASAAGPSLIGDRMESRGASDSVPAITSGQSLNNAAETTATSGASGAYQAAYDDPNYGFSNTAPIAIRSLKDYTGTQTLPTMHDAGQPSPLVFKYTAGDSLAGWTNARAGNASYFDINGTVQIAGSGVTRDAHYLAGVRHWLLEEARTNSALWSEDFTNAAWSKTLCTIGGSVTTPDGTPSVTTCGWIPNNGTQGSSLFNAAGYTWTDNAPQAFSFFAKPGNKIWAFINLRDKANNTHFNWINASTGALGTTDGSCTLKTWALANGWYRIEARLSSAATGGATVSASLAFMDGDGAVTVTGDGSTAAGYFWGAQMEIDKNSVSSYVKTTNASASRVADTAPQRAHNSVPQARTLYISQTMLEVTAGSGNNTTLIGIGSASPFSAYHRIAHTPQQWGGTQFVNAGITANASFNGVPSLGDLVEMRSAVDNGLTATFGVSINGGAESTGTATNTSPFATIYTGANYVLGNNEANPVQGVFAMRGFKDVLGPQSMAAMRSF